MRGPLLLAVVIASLAGFGCRSTGGGPSETPATRGDRTVPHTSDTQGPGNSSPPTMGEKTHFKGGVGAKR